MIFFYFSLGPKENPNQKITYPTKNENVIVKNQNNLQQRNKVAKVDSDPEIESSGHFMAYFILFSVVIVIAYLVYHNRKKVCNETKMSLMFIQ